MDTAARITELLAQEKADLLAYFNGDPRFVRLLTLASETTATFTTFINT